MQTKKESKGKKPRKQQTKGEKNYGGERNSQEYLTIKKKNKKPSWIVKISCMVIGRKKKNQIVFYMRQKKCVSTSCHENIAQWLAQKTNPWWFWGFSGGFVLVFGFFFQMYNQYIRKAKLEKEVTTLYLTFRQAKAWFFSHSVRCKTTEDNVILRD